MTLIGAFEMTDVVLFADRQETITDYAKWDVNKISYFEFQGDLRFLVAGAGDANVIDMIWEQVCDAAKERAHENPAIIKNPADIKNVILRTVSRITRKSILPYSRNDRPMVDLIWIVQKLGPQSQETRGLTWGIDIFHTYGLTVNTIQRKYFSGNPIQLVTYLSNLYFDHLIIGTEEAEAFAAYLLWEAKEYDPTCGKHSDIVTIKRDGGIRRMPLYEVKYWEEHFAHLKESLKILPLLSCSASPFMDQVYNPKERTQRFITALQTLTREQKKMRAKIKDRRSDLEKRLTANLRKTAAKFSKPSTPQKSKDQQ